MDPKDLPKGFEGQRSENPEEKMAEEDDDDEEYYREAVGQAPDKDLFDKDKTRKRRSDFKDTRFKKKRKFGDKNSNSKNKSSDRPSFATKKKSSDFSSGGTKGNFKNRPSSGGAKAKFKVSMKKPIKSMNNRRRAK